MPEIVHYTFYDEVWQPKPRPLPAVFHCVLDRCHLCRPEVLAGLRQPCDRHLTRWHDHLRLHGARKTPQRCKCRLRVLRPGGNADPKTQCSPCAVCT